MGIEAQIRQDFGLGADTDALLFVTPEDALKSAQLRGQSHYIRRAFHHLRLDGILCIDGIPTVYLKKFDRPIGRIEINELHSKLWNQGTGTLLVILDPSYVYIFSSMVWPSKDDGDIGDHPALVETLSRVTNTLESYQLLTRVASGQYYRHHSSKFQQSNSVDKHLLDNLGMIGKLLSHNQTAMERKRVHSFLGRIIFTCYLIDRKIIKLQNFSFSSKNDVSTLLDLLKTDATGKSGYPAKARDLLYMLFKKLREDFNGSMFDTDFDEEKESISDVDINILIRFLRGEQLESGQQTLGFWAYDFSVIPVETISAIYEKFLEEESAVEKEQQGAFYTPKHLAEMVVNEATSDFDTLLDKRCLDPACGSGIFLVILFNRIAEEILKQNPRAHQHTRLNKLLDVLENQICGVDVNKTACRITCFSLYIAFLDQFDPPTLIELQKKSGKSGKILPKLLAYKDNNYQNTNTPVIYEGNFFDAALPIRDDFDIIVGNPPWVGRNQSVNAEVKQWVSSSENNPFLEEVIQDKGNPTAIFIHQNQIAQAFMWKTQLHVTSSGHISLLLPIQVLLNQTDAFQHTWFAKTKVHRIFNLSDFRMFLFQDAKRPATIIQFGKPHTRRSEEMFEYIVPKVRQQDPRSGLIRIFPEDRKFVKIDDILQVSRPKSQCDGKDLLSGAFVFWKSLQWGTPRDVAFIEYLRHLDSLDHIAGNSKENKRWIKGKGFQPWYQASFDLDPKYGEPDPIPGNLDDPFIETTSNSLQMFVLESETITLKDRLKELKCSRRSEETPEEDLKASMTGFHRARDERLFNPPCVLINKGFSKFAFVDFKVFYQDSITGISGDDSDAALLRFLVVYAKSKLARYFSFHTSGSWGTERTEVRVHELMRLPFPLPESPDSHKDADTIIKDVANRMMQLQSKIAKDFAKARLSKNFELQSMSLTQSRHKQVEQLQTDLEPLVYRYFKLTQEEISLVEDTCNIIIPSATPSKPDSRLETTKQTSTDDRQQYATILCNTLNKWANLDQPKGKKQPFFFHAIIIQFPTVGMTLVTLKQAKKLTHPVEVTETSQLEKIVARFHESSTAKRGSFQYLRGLIIGDGNQIHILKPDMLGQWMQTSALNDADQIFHAIVRSKRK